MLCSELFYWNFKNVYDCTVTFVVFYVNIFHLTGKGKWDDIMTQIAEGQKRSSENKLPLKEVKSKIFADFKPPKLIRPLNIKLVFLETLFQDILLKVRLS